MDNSNSNKIKVTPEMFAKMEQTETELRDLLQAGDATQSMRDALKAIQGILEGDIEIASSGEAK